MRSERFRFFVFTCRDPKTDFRLPLVDALRSEHETYYVWLRRRPMVSGPAFGDRPQELSLPDFLRRMRGFRRDDRVNVYLNSTNTYFPGMTAVLRRILPAGVWVFDMHDDLRYHNTGWKRRREDVIITALRRLSHVTVHAAPTLQELFADSQHLGNASNIGPLPRPVDADSEVLIIASFDERFDFNFISELAQRCPSMRFHLHGWTRSDDPATLAEINAITARNNNVLYHGPYAMADLPGILRRYQISVAPYRMNSPITRYIDPLRFYHCLNAGLEVVSTDIPQARYMADWVHVVSDVTTCAETLQALQAGHRAKQPAYQPITWEQRADRLLEIVRVLPRTTRLLQHRIEMAERL